MDEKAEAKSKAPNLLLCYMNYDPNYDCRMAGVGLRFRTDAPAH